MTRISTLKTRLVAKEPLIGTFVKTPSPAICETLGYSDFDLLCLDAEHAAFDRSALDQCILACRSVDMPTIVRVPASRAEYILNALDLGAQGVLAPHIKNADEAENVVNASHYLMGRGYAGGTRAAQGRSMTSHVYDSNTDVIVIGQIEDKEAIDSISDLMAVDGIDCFFIGRSDLTISLGLTDPNNSKVIDMVEEVCEYASAAGRIIGMFTSNIDEIPHWRNLGVSLFLLGSDQNLMLQGAADLNARIKEML